MRIQLTTLSALVLPLAAVAQDSTSSSTAPNATSPVSAPLGSSIAVSSAAATTIYTDIATQASSAVPGLAATFQAFDRVFGSPNGNWVLSADTDLATTLDEIILLNNVVVAQEGTQADWAVVGENWGLIDTKLGVNDAGEVVAATNSSGVTTADEYIIMRDTSGIWNSLAREGDATGLVALPGTTWGASLDTAALTSGGVAGWSADLIGGATTTTNDLLVLGGSVLMQNGVTVPPGQIASETIENFDIDDFHVSADGLHWIVLGDITGATTDDDVAIVDGSVVLQENVIIPGSGFANPIDLSGIVNVFMDAGGSWYARGNNDVTEQDWVVRNGVVIATLGQSVDGVSAEVWDDTAFGDCFFMHTGNSVGDYVIGGVTNNVDPLRDGLLVLNGTTELARQGDPVDLDGNGLFDDDAFFNTFGNDDGYLSDSGDFYFVATLMNGAGTGIGDGFFRIDTTSLTNSFCFGDGSGTACPCGNTGAAGEGCAHSGGVGAILSCGGSTSVGLDDITFSVTQGSATNAAIVFTGTLQAAGGAGIVFGDGLRCATGMLVRFNVVFLDGSGAGTWGPGLQPVGGWASGDTRQVQCWFRDPAGPCSGAFNTSQALTVTFQP